jgi:glyoxylase-like metal-dependent hydrolase (beta-lactamase superfamily II)
MLEIYGISLPTPYEVGPVNSYLIKNHPYTLIDPGPGSTTAKKHLTESLAVLGVSMKDIRRVVVTHCHPDHSGLARWVSEQTGATVYVHRLEVRKLEEGYDKFQERLPFLREAGVPEKVLQEIINDKDPLPYPTLPQSGVEVLLGGEELDFEGGALQILHLPGHSSGHICLYEPQDKVLLSGDFILKNITPNPIMEADPADFKKRIPSLRQHFASLKKMEEIDIRLILPGHRESINNSREAVLKAQIHHHQRLDVVLSILNGNSLNTYQIMQAIYPDLKGFQRFLGVSEIFAHIDYLQAEGKVIGEDHSGVVYYRKK